MNTKAMAMACLCTAAAACSSSEDSKDMEQPTIATNGRFEPQNCSVFGRGDTIHFATQMADNAELGNFNIEIHNNFDHHSHSTEATECDPETDKAPVKPWVYNTDHAVPRGRTVYDAKVDIAVPADIDDGDYHFMVRLTDSNGWQQLKSVSIKIK